MADFYGSNMGPLAALSLFGLMGNRRKKRGGMSGLLEPTQPRDARSEKQDLGLGFNFRSAGPDPRGTRTRASEEERKARLGEQQEARRAKYEKRRDIEAKYRPQLEKLERERRRAIKRKRLKEAEEKGITVRGN